MWIAASLALSVRCACRVVIGVMGFGAGAKNQDFHFPFLC